MRPPPWETPEQKRYRILCEKYPLPGSNGQPASPQTDDVERMLKSATARCYRRHGLEPPPAEAPAPPLDEADATDPSMAAAVKCWLRHGLDPSSERWCSPAVVKAVKATLPAPRRVAHRSPGRKRAAHQPRRRVIVSDPARSACSAASGDACRHCGGACLLRKRWNSTTTAKSVHTKLIDATRVRHDPKYDRCVSAIISTDRRDRDREVLLPGGCDLGDYRRNPVVMWAHDYAGEPLGKCLEIERNGDAIWALIQFADTPRGREVFGLYQAGVLNAFSVGFSPADSQCRTATLEDKQRWPGVERVYHRWSLMEISCVPVPANGDALVEAVNAGQVVETAESFAA